MIDRTAILFLLLALPALVAAALIWIQVQNLRIRSWRETNGRITVSHSVARDVRKVDHRDEGTDGHARFVAQETIQTRNFALLSYAFEVDGKSYIGSRIDLGVDSGDNEVAERLRRYPLGKIVRVIYDPRDPAESILERVDPKKIRAGWLAVLVLVALIVGAVYGVDYFAAMARSGLPRPRNTPLVVAFALFGLVIFGFGRMISRKGAEMKSWSVAPGEIVESAVATTTRTEDYANSSRTSVQTIYTPRIVYRYRVGPDSLQGDSVGTRVDSSSPSGPTKAIVRYPLGAKVKVFYNPKIPTESTLSPDVDYAPAFLYALSALFVFASLAVAGLIPFL
jgi:Protein of unknown function (DUF3592)